MKVPKYVQQMIDRRQRAAEQFNHYDYELSTWLERHGVITEECDVFGGVESIVNAGASADRIRKAIKDTEEG